MRKLDFLKLLFRLGVGILAIIALATCATPTAQAAQGVLFNDTFDATSANTTPPYFADINENIGPTRQSGAFVTQFGSVGYYANNIWGHGSQVWNTFQYDDGGGFVSTAQNFGGVFSQGGLTVEWNTFTSTAGGWGLLGVGQVATEWQANASYGAQAQPGISFFTNSNGADGTGSAGVQINNNSAAWAAGTVALPAPNVLGDPTVRFKAEFTDPTDGNPFDGQGETVANYFQWDTASSSYMPIMSYTIGNGGLPSALITMQGVGGEAYFDNLKVTGNVDAFANPWVAGYSGSWNAPGSWTTGVPNGAGSIAAFLDKTTYPYVTLDIAPTVGAIVMAGPSVQLVPDSVNNYSITLDNSPHFGTDGIVHTATIDVLGGSQWIDVPLVLSNSNLAIAITTDGVATASNPDPSGWLTLSGGLTANGKNVTVSCGTNANWWERPAQRPAGHLYVDTTPVTGIGTLSLNFVNMHINGTTVEAQEVTGGTSFLFIDGGSLVKPGTTTGPSVDVMKLELSGYSSFTAGVGTTVRTPCLTSADKTGVFTLDGGTLAFNPYYTAGGIGVDYTQDNWTNPALPLAHFYIGANGGTINTAPQWVGTYNSIENAPGVVTSGPLTIVGTGVFSVGTDNSGWNGGMIIKDKSGFYATRPEAVGTGPIDFSEGGCLGLGAGFTGVIANNITTHGPGVAGAFFPVLISGADSVSAEFSGTINMSDGPGTAGDPATFTDMVNAGWQPMVISGKMTGTGSVTIGSIVGYGSQAHFGGRVFTIAGTESNDFAGVTYVVGQVLELGKDNSGGVGVNTAVAVPHDLVLDPQVKDFSASAAALVKDNQTSTNTVVRFQSPDLAVSGRWATFDLNGHTTTVRGLQSLPGVANPLNGVENLSIAHNLGVPNPELDTVPTNAAVLTIKTQDGDNFTFTGYIADAVHTWVGMEGTTGALSIIKDGPGTQTLLPVTYWSAGGSYIYTGGTTVKAGVLDISSVNAVFNDQQPGLGIYGGFTPNSTVKLEGGTLKASGLLQDTITRGTTTSGMLEAGGTAFPILEVNKAVDIAAAVIDPGHTLSLTSGVKDVIDNVSGSGSLLVTGSTVLISNSINVDTLQIGGVAPVAYTTISVPPPTATTVPEPSAMLLLAIAGSLIAWFRLRK